MTPWIIGRDSAGVIHWLQQVFDAEELDRMADEHGHIGHAEVRIGDSVVMLFDKPDWRGHWGHPEPTATAVLTAAQGLRARRGRAV